MVNTLYTQRHGYDFLALRCSPNTELPHLGLGKGINAASFAKPWMMLQHLPHYDVLAFVESDAYFNDFNQTIPAFLREHMRPDASLLFAPDCLFHHVRPAAPAMHLPAAARHHQWLYK